MRIYRKCAKMLVFFLSFCIFIKYITKNCRFFKLVPFHTTIKLIVVKANSNVKASDMTSNRHSKSIFYHNIRVTAELIRIKLTKELMETGLSIYLFCLLP